jgi:hypothetical protein
MRWPVGCLLKLPRGRRAGVPVSTLRGWEGGRGLPGLPAALRPAGALGVPVKRLAEGVEDPAGDGASSDPENPPRTRKEE